LRASSQEEEYELARELDKAGILFQVAWWHNVGGVMSGYEEYTKREEASIKELLSNIEKICTLGTRTNLISARTKNITPTEMAYKTVETMIYG